MRAAEQYLLARASDLVGDRDSRQHEFTVQLRALDSVRSGTVLGLPALLALSSTLIGKSLKGPASTSRMAKSETRRIPPVLSPYVMNPI
jgi:hypothetical protein